MSQERFIEYWDNYDRPHNDMVKEHLPEEDLVLKGKYLFLDKKFKLSAKTTFSNTLEGLKNTADYNLRHQINPDSSYNLISKSSGDTFLEGNFHLSKNEDVSFNLYVDSNLKINDDKQDWLNKLQLRCVSSHAIVSFGFEDWNTFKQPQPTTYSAWGLIGNQYKNWNYWGGAGIGYSVSNKYVKYGKFLFGLKNKDWTVYLESKLNRTKELDENDVEEVKNNHSLKLIAQNQFNSDFKIYGDLEYAFQKKQALYNLCGDYKVDQATKLKVRARGKDNSLSVGINRRFNNFVNFAFMTRINVNSKKIQDSENNKTSPWFSYKFGVIAEFFN